MDIASLSHTYPTTFTLSGGIKLVPSVESSRPDVPAFETPLIINQIQIGGEFTIGLDITSRLGMNWYPDYDETMISLIEEKF